MRKKIILTAFLFFIVSCNVCYFNNIQVYLGKGGYDEILMLKINNNIIVENFGKNQIIPNDSIFQVCNKNELINIQFKTSNIDTAFSIKNENIDKIAIGVASDNKLYFYTNLQKEVWYED